MSPIDEYLSKVPAPYLTHLEHIRELVKQLVPAAVEGIHYGMPGFKYQGHYLLGYAAFKDHMSLFPTPGPITALHDQFTGYKLAKGTIQFTPGHTIPDDLLIKVIENRLENLA